MEDDLASFESPRLLLDAARTDIDELEQICAAFVDDCIAPYRVKRDNATGEDVFFIPLRKELPGRVRTQTYRLVSDLKHALDQATGDAAIILNRPNAKGIHFPIGRTVQDFQGSVTRHLRSVEPSLVEFFLALDINERGNLDLYRFLALAGPNKHQRIVSITTSNHTRIHTNRLIHIQAPATINIGKHHRLQNEIEWLRVGVGGQIAVEGDLYDALQPTVQVKLADGRPPFDAPLAASLRRFLDECDTIFSRIEAEALRLRRL